MADQTETIRKQMVVEINAEPGSRAFLEAKHGQVWTTSELSDDFEVIGFMAPVVVVIRKRDGQKGSLFFQHRLGSITASSRIDLTRMRGASNQTPLFYK